MFIIKVLAAYIFRLRPTKESAPEASLIVRLRSTGAGQCHEIFDLYFLAQKLYSTSSVSEPEPPGFATIRVEPEPMFLLAGARAGAAFSKVAPDASF